MSAGGRRVVQGSSVPPRKLFTGDCTVAAASPSPCPRRSGQRGQGDRPVAPTSGGRRIKEDMPWAAFSSVAPAGAAMTVNRRYEWMAPSLLA